MSWPYRDYSTYLGRWLEQEKLGMIPNDTPQINPFSVLKQYERAVNLYEAFASNPDRNRDKYGLVADPKDVCCEVEPYVTKDQWKGYDWWNPVTPGGAVKCEEPCKWHNKSDTDRRFRVRACHSASASLPLAAGCGAPLAIAGIVWELLPTSMKSVHVCNIPIRRGRVSIRQTCVCRLTLWRKCGRRCCNRWRGLWSHDKKIYKYFRASGTVQPFLGPGGPPICSCAEDWHLAIIHMSPEDFQNELNKVIDCPKDL